MTLVPPVPRDHIKSLESQTIPPFFLVSLWIYTALDPHARFPCLRYHVSYIYPPFTLRPFTLSSRFNGLSRTYWPRRCDSAS